MTLQDLTPFVRYASEGAVSPAPHTVRTYDCRLFYLLRGNVSITVEGQLHTLSPGALLLLPPGVRYLIQAMPETQMFVLNFDHTMAFSKIETPFPVVPEDEPFTPPEGMVPVTVTDAEAFSRPIYLTGMQALEEPLRELVEEKRLRRIGCEAKASALIKSILIDCLRAVPVGGGEKDTAKRLLAWLRENCCRCPSAEDVSRAFGYHPVHLNRIMHREAGMTLHQYVLHCRLEEAKHLLESTSLSVEDIALQTGFCYVSNFSGCFRRETGITPGAYRKAYRGHI